jgi:hypothetical protein
MQTGKESVWVLDDLDDRVAAETGSAPRISIAAAAITVEIRRSM